jgi:hypothetical protein
LIKLIEANYDIILPLNQNLNMNLAQLKYLIIDKIYDIDDEEFLLELKKLLDKTPQPGYKYRLCEEDEAMILQRKADKS